MNHEVPKTWDMGNLLYRKRHQHVLLKTEKCIFSTELNACVRINDDIALALYLTLEVIILRHNNLYDVVIHIILVNSNGFKFVTTIIIYNQSPYSTIAIYITVLNNSSWTTLGKQDFAISL